MPYTSRPYQDPADYALMRQLLVETLHTIGLPVYATIGDLDWWRSIHPDPCAVASSRLWFDAQGNLAGFTWQEIDLVDLMSHPQHREVENEMLFWAEERQRSAHRNEGRMVYQRVWCFESDTFRRDLLNAHGYIPADWRMYCRSRSLARPLPEPLPLPSGYSIHPLWSEAGLGARVAAQRNAFAPSQMTPAKYRAVLHSPTYNPELDLVVEAPDNSIAAFATIWYDGSNRLGEFEPVGCHSAHRRLGLTKTLMVEGLRKLQTVGAQTAMVYCEADEEAPNRLYESLDFAQVDLAVTWKKYLS